MVTVAHDVEQGTYQSEGCWFDNWQLKSVCQSITEQHTEPQVAFRCVRQSMNVCGC